MNPFRPGGPVEPEYFIGRKDEIKLFERFLKSTKNGNPFNIAVLGERGIGKTSLLRKFENIGEKSGSIGVRGSLDPSISNLPELCTYILELMREKGVGKSGRIKEFFKKYNLERVKINILGLQAEIKKGYTGSLQITFRKELEGIWENIGKETGEIILLIDEAEQLENIKGSLPFLRNVFQSLSEKRAGYMLILSGKLELFRKIKDIHSPLARFLRPIHLCNLSDDEVKEAIIKPLENTVRIDENVLTKVIEESAGHPYIVQVFGYMLFENMKDKKINIKVFEKTYPEIIRFLSAQFFNDLYYIASDSEREILKVIASLDKNMFSPKDIVQKSGKSSKRVSTCFQRLVEKDAIRKLSRGNYELYHKLFKEYLKSKTEK